MKFSRPDLDLILEYIDAVESGYACVSANDGCLGALVLDHQSLTLLVGPVRSC